MGFIFNHVTSKHFVSLGAVAALATNQISAPLNASIHHEFSAGVVDLAFVGVKLEKLIEKMNRYKDQRNLDKLMGTMFDIKVEVENYLGQSVNIDSIFDNVQKNLKKEGHKLNKDVWKNYKKTFKSKEKKHNHKMRYMAQCIEFGIDYDPFNAQFDFEAKHRNPDEAPEVLIPFEVALGVTCCLCGGFLYLVPLPMCQPVGTGVFNFGIMMIVKEMYINPTIDDVKKQQK